MREMRGPLLCTMLVAIVGCAGAQQHEASDTHAAHADSRRKLPSMEFPVQSHWEHGRLALQLISSDSGLVVHWTLPRNMQEPVQAQLAPGTGYPEVLLYRGKDVAEYLRPSGSPRFARPHERAVSGTLQCTPTGEKTAKLVLKDLRFQTVEIRQVGPLDVRLDVTPPP